MNPNTGKFRGSIFVLLFVATPYWVNKPQDINLVINDNGELLCEAAGIPVPTISWLVNGVPSAEAGVLE